LLRQVRKKEFKHLQSGRLQCNNRKVPSFNKPL
jgi:hypothetical protein